jgi:hypothetical protein
MKSERETMSDSELNLKIAEFLEPKPNADDEYDHERSAWRWVPEVHDRKGNVIYRGELEPRDFVNDPACTLMLLTKLSKFGIVRIDTQDICNGSTEIQVNVQEPGNYRTLQRAIAEEFAKANNLI